MVQRLAITLLALLAAYVLKRVVQHFVQLYVEEPARQYRTSKIVGRIATFLGLLAILVIWTPQRGDLLTLLTVIGAGLLIATREALLSFVGWFHILIRSPYRQGHRIEINGVRGDVVDVRIMHTTMMEVGGWVDADQSTGRLVHVPNAWIFQEAVYNYTQGFDHVWNELSFTVTYGSDWQLAQNILLNTAGETAGIVERQVKQQLREMSHEYLVHYGVLTPFVYVRAADNGIKLTLRYLCEVRKRRGTEHALTIQILEAFREEETIQLANDKGDGIRPAPEDEQDDKRDSGAQPPFG